MKTEEGQVLAFMCARNQLISIRNYMARNVGDRYRPTSRRLSEDQFEAHIAHSQGEPPRRRARKKK